MCNNYIAQDGKTCVESCPQGHSVSPNLSPSYGYSVSRHQCVDTSLIIEERRTMKHPIEILPADVHDNTGNSLDN